MPSLAAIRFSALLAEHTGQLTHFVELLKREQELLAEGRIEALLELAADKTAAVRQLQDAENTRALALASDGVEATAQGIAAFVEREGDALSEAWQRYLALAREANELNLISGKLVRQQMQNNQLALNVLLASSEIPLYDADGQSSPRPTGRLIGSF